MPKHYKFSPSGASRWLTCRASVEGGCDGKTTDFAAEGTVAHDLAEVCYLLGYDPGLHLGQEHKVDGHTITIDQEMVDGVQIYLDYLLSFEGGVEVEGQIEHNSLADFGGTVDACYLARPEIIDFKYGKGVAVEVEENVQLSCYALLFCNKHNGGELCDVKLTVIQPRVSHADGPVRSWTASKEYLTQFFLRICEAMERPESFSAGDHCRWCPRAVNCPELKRIAEETAAADFDAIGDEMTTEKAAEILRQRKAIVTYLDAVESWAKGQAELGSEIPGFKLVESIGHRQYSVDESVVLKKCRALKLGKKEIYRQVLLSPAQLEKIAGRQLVDSITERPRRGVALVPDSDRRKALSRTTLDQDFEGCAE